ncbi:MAG TPA: putative O-glycosylation ligase, exosortase A system-associated [Woeseiaceae bacterium]|nr:putative O-glycosylation ligase, exosortase A system-associated [Woeseiaceae bacterium]
MRDLIVIGIVLVGALLALRRPQVGVLLWTWVSIMNPHRYTWGFAYSAPVAAIAAGSTLVGLVFTRHRRFPFQGAPAWWLLAFAIWMTISWRFGIDPEGDYPEWDKVMKIYMMTFVTLALLYSKKEILAYAWVTVGSLAVLAAKGGLFTVLTGGNYRVFGPPGSFIADNNDFALATVIAIPMIYFLQRQLEQRWMRYLMTATIMFCVASVLGSQSRGGLLALAAMGVIFWWRGPNKVLIAIGMLVVLLAFLPMMPDAWWDRMNTISTYQQDASAMGRINAWHVAWHTAQHYFFGGGMSYQHEFLFEEYGPFESTVRAAHSIYFQILGNHGFIGLFLFLMIWVSGFRSAGKLRKLAAKRKEGVWARDLGAMVQVSLIGYAAGGAFLSLPYFDLPYNLLVMVMLARKWVEREGWHEPAQTLLLGRPVAEPVGALARSVTEVRRPALPGPAIR